MKALTESRNLEINGNKIKMAWAPGKGLKDKKFKDFWEVELGASFIPISKIDKTMDLDTLEEGGVIDESTITSKIKELREERDRDLATPNSNSLPPQVNIPMITQQPYPMPFNTYGVMPLLPNDMTENQPDIVSMQRLAPTMIPIPDPAIFSGAPPMLSMPQLYQNMWPPRNN